MIERKFIPYTHYEENKTFLGFKGKRRYFEEKRRFTEELKEWGGNRLSFVRESTIDYDYPRGMEAAREVNNGFT